jgi:(2R)-3-sulfolactate dehydrogenase (NADP+)
LQAGGIKPNAQLKLLQICPALLSLMVMMVWDIGSYNMLQRLQQNAQWLMELQAVGVGRSNHCGALGIYVRP